MRWWERQIGGTTRGRIISLMRRGAATVEELARALEVTDNAVRPQLQRLEQEGVVRATGTRQGSGAGKPATTYEIAPSAEAALSAAYAPVLTTLLQTLSDRLPEEELDRLLREVGRRLGPSHPTGSSLESRVQAAAAVLAALGGEVDVERTDEGFLLRGYACPLAAAVKAQPGACHTVEELVGAVVGAPVQERCDRAGSARCRFQVLAPRA